MQQRGKFKRKVFLFTNCHFTAMISQEKEKEMGGFCSAEARKIGTVSVFSADLGAFKKGRCRTISVLNDSQHPSNSWQQ